MFFNRQISFISLFFFAVSSFAQDAHKLYEEVVLKNGDVYKGFIQCQDIKKGSVTFAPVYHIKRTNCESIQSRTTGSVSWKDLDDAVKTWYLANSNQAKSDDDNLETVTFTYKDGKSSGKSIIIEEGKEVMYLEMTKDPVEFPAKDISSIRKSARPQNQVSGIYDVVETKDAVFRGQVLEKKMGEEVRILLDNGVVQVININDITAIKKQALDVETDVMSQTPFVETIMTQKGGSYKGLITKESYPMINDVQTTVIEITKQDKSLETILYSDILSVSRERNSDYVVNVMRTIEDGQIFVCGKVAQETVFEEIKTGKFVLTETENVEHLVLKSSEVEDFYVEMNDTKENKKVFLVPLKEVENKRYLVLTDIYKGFESSDFVNNEYECTNEVVYKGVRKVSYGSLPQGDYLLYRKSDKRCYWIEVTN